jgi:hypothetical protein
MNLAVPLLYAKQRPIKPAAIEYLAYRVKPIHSRQARLRNHFAIEPNIDLAKFSNRAVIDFVVLRLILGRKSQFQHIKHLVARIIGRQCYVDALDAGSGGSALVFDIKIHDPTMPELVAVTKAVDAQYDLQLLPIMAMLEISVDFYPSRPDEIERARLLKALVNSFVPTRDVFESAADRPRFVYGQAASDTKFPLFWSTDLTEAQARHMAMSTEADTPPAIDATFYAGRKHADSAWRIMDKILDRQNPVAGTRTELPEKARRVRIEVTLQRQELDRIGVNYLHDLKSLSFTSLQKRYFRFWLPTFHGPSASLQEICRAWQDRMRWDKFCKTGVIGLLRMDHAWEEHREEQRRRSAPEMHKSGLRLPKARRTGVGQAGALVAYEEMNGAVSSALERLGLRVASDFSRAEKRHRDVWFMRGR